MKKNIFSLFKFFFGWPLSVLAIVFIGKSVVTRAPVILSQIHGVNGILLISGLLSFVVYFYLRGISWQKILAALGHQVGFEEANYLWGKSEIRRYVPGNVWSFFSRAFLFAEKNIPKKDTARGLVIEAELIVIGATIISLFSLPFLWKKFFYGGYTPVLLINTIIVITLLGVAVYIFQRVFIKKIPLLQKKSFAVLFPGFSPKEFCILVGYSALSFFFLGFGYFLTAYSVVNLHPQMIFELSGFFVFTYLCSYLSLITPSGLGVREGIITLGLSRIMLVEVAGFVALFTRFILIIAEIIFLATAYALVTIRNARFLSVKKWIHEHHYAVWLGIGILIYCVYFTSASFMRYDNYYTGRFDLGNMAQTVWNTSHGRIFQLTDPNGTNNVSRLATHADFILIFLAPFYYLWPSPKVLLLVQTIVVALGAIFVYKIAKYLLKSPQFALLFGVLYLINPSVQRSNLYDFHSVTLATTFLLGAYYFMLKKRYLWFLFFSVLAGITKEQVWLIIALFGGYIAVFQKKRILGASIFASGIGITYYLISYAIPQALGSEHFALSYYSDYGDKPISVVKNIIFSPVKTIMTLLRPDQVEYYKQIFMPVGFYALFAPLSLIFAGADFAINLLSNNAQLHQIYYQYTATVTPFIIIASIYGVRYLWRVVPRMPKYAHLLILLAMGIYSAFTIGPMPGGLEPNIAMFVNPIINRTEVDQFLSSIPKKYSVAASNNVGSHLSHRQRIYTLPIGIDRADMIILLPDPTTPQLSLTQQELVASLSADMRYRLLYQKDEFVAFKKRGIQ